MAAATAPAAALIPARWRLVQIATRTHIVIDVVEE